MTRIKVCQDHEGLSFGDLELNLEGHLEVIIEFLNGNPFLTPDLKRAEILRSDTLSMV